MSVDRAEAERRIVEYIAGQLLSGRLERELTVDEDLLGSGLLESLGVMRLVQFLEQSFPVTVDPADVTIENFQSVATILAYLVRRAGS